MKRASGWLIIVLAALLAISCSAQPASTPGASVTTASPSAPPSTQSATPTATPTAAVTVLQTTVPLPSFASISAPSGTVVWALVGGMLLFRSTDRGDTWEQRPLPSPLANAEISFASDREGWLSATGSAANQCQSQSIAIWHTSDAGATWQPLSTSGIADTQCKGQLSFTDATHGFLVASDPSHAPVIYRTSDGGATWSASPALPDPPGITTSPPGGPTLQPGRVRAFGSALLVPVEGPSGAIAAYYVYSSTNGGASWSYSARAPNADGALALISASRWLLLVPPDQSQETTDAGKTWHKYTTNYTQAAPIRPDVVFGDASVGYATVRGAIQRTVDGGAHWTALKTPGTS